MSRGPTGSRGALLGHAVEGIFRLDAPPRQGLAFARKDRLLVPRPSPPVRTLNASKARKSFARILESVVSENEPVVIVRYRQPIAAIVPISRLSPTERNAVVRRRLKDTQPRG